ncbi:MAG: citrate/2-methylcitrate synthase [Nanoarchaeota archaeon]|nr:citrate/2-methylcitrate synthase [Nanoarchaeota archaeon]
MAYVFDKHQLELVDHGLADTKAIITIKSKVDGSGDGRLYYEGYSIEELADKSTFEEVCFLLLNDRLPDQTELDSFRKILSGNRKLSAETLSIIRSMKHDEPMALLRTAVSSLSASDSEKKRSPESDIRRALDIISKFPSLISSAERMRKGLIPFEPDSAMGTAEAFLYMLNGKKPSEKDTRLLDVLMIIMAEHGMNASTFTARLVVSTDSDLYSAVTAAIGALKGPLHGGANEEAIKMMGELMKKFSSSKDLKKDVREWVLGQLSQKKKIMGIGHRVYTGGDPRARILKKKIEEILGKDDEMYILANTIDETMKKEKGLSANVDLYSGILYSRMGIPEHLFTPLFAMARIAGWTAHILEQRANNKLLRPKGVYIEEVRPLDAKYIPIEKR